MIDAKRYARLSPIGMAKVISNDDPDFPFSIVFKRFDVETGAEVTDCPEVQPFRVDEINLRLDEITKELQALTLVLEECKV